MYKINNRHTEFEFEMDIGSFSTMCILHIYFKHILHKFNK